MRFQDIKQFPFCSYRIDIGWDYLEKYLEDSFSKAGGLSSLDLNPDFQRGHVWTEEQQVAYCEYILRGGRSGRELYFNHPGWMSSYKGEYVIVDGKQRLQAVRQFLANKIKVFGKYYNEFEDRLPMDARFSWNIAKLQTRKEVLEWYLGFNAGGSVHTKEELDKVRDLLEKESDHK